MGFLHLRILLMLFTLCLPYSLNQETGVWLRLYANAGEDGEDDYLETQDYLRKLDYLSFDDSAVSVCGAGVWLLYEHYDFDGSGGYGASSVMMLSDGECAPLPTEIAGKVSSVRQAGSPVNPGRSSLTLFAYSKYRGREMFLTRAWPDLDIFKDEAYSAIVTGDQPWTVYTYENFQGSGTCLRPQEGVEVNGNRVGAGFFPTYHELGSSGAIRSARPGCN